MISKKFTDRPKKTTLELINLINRHREDWWPDYYELAIERSAEHDWIAIVQKNKGVIIPAPFADSVSRVAAQLRLRNAWAGY
jgi:hypothetical protein